MSRRTSASSAARLAAAFGTLAASWLGMQAEHDLAKAQPVEVERLARSGTWDDFFAEPGVDLGARDEGGVDADAFRRLERAMMRLEQRMEAGFRRVQCITEYEFSEPLGLPVDVVYWCLIFGDEGDHHVVVPDLPECTARGETYAEAMKEIEQVVRKWLVAEQKGTRPALLHARPGGAAGARPCGARQRAGGLP